MYTVSTRYLSRESAVLILNGRLYEEYNHQYALLQALEFEGRKLEGNVDELAEGLVNTTHKMSMDNEIATFDLFIGEEIYVVGHTKEHMINHFDTICEYATEHEATLGYFVSLSSREFIVIEDTSELFNS